MPFKKGKQKTGGRQSGQQNHLTKTVKESVLSVFNEIQSDPKLNLSAFARRYPREFYTIAARLIPAEMNQQVTGDITINVKRA